MFSVVGGSKMLVGVELLVVQLKGEEPNDSCDERGVDKKEFPGLNSEVCWCAAAFSWPVSDTFDHCDGWLCGGQEGARSATSLAWVCSLGPADIERCRGVTRLRSSGNVVRVRSNECGAHWLIL